MRRLALTVVAAFAITSGAVASPQPGSPDAQTLADAEAVAIQHPHPDYPASARVRRLTGRGIVVGIVDSKSGLPKSVTIEQTTGHSVLDDAILRAFRQWKFRPGTIRRFRLPVTYTMEDPRRWPFVAAPLH